MLFFRMLLLSIAAAVTPVGAHPNHQLDLTYTTPGVAWSPDALPLGNGYFGTLVLGGVAEDRLRLTDPALRDRDGVLQPLGDLVIRTGHDPQAARTFLRRLDLQTASVEISYRDGRIRHRREYFSSYPDRVTVGRLRAIRKKSLHLSIAWSDPRAGSDRTAHVAYLADKRRLVVTGGLGPGGSRFRSEIEFRLKGGEISGDGDGVEILGADEVTLLLSVEDPTGKETSFLDRLEHDDAIALYQRHLPSYQEPFHSMYLTLEGGAKTQFATPKRRQLYGEKPEEDPGFEELVFQYGRYLLLASSREASPTSAHARGIWWYPPSVEHEFLNNGPEDRHPGLVGLVHGGAAPSQLPVRAAEAKGGFTLPDLGPWRDSGNAATDGVVRLLESAQEGQGNAAYAQLRVLLQNQVGDDLLVVDDNLAVNMALVRGMTDLFAHETPDGVLRWETSLPEAWPDGSVVGLRTPSYELAYVWQGGRFLEGYLTRLDDGECLLMSQVPLVLDQPGSETVRQLEPDQSGLVRFPMAGEETWRLRAVEEE